MSIEQLPTHVFQSFKRMVEEEAAIVVHDDKKSLIEMRLNPVAAERGFDNVEALINAVHTRCERSLKKDVVEALTTHETSFFREPGLFEALQTEVIPQLIERRKTQRSLRIWSAACSSGQEPYTLAIMMLENFPQIVSNWDLEIFATDVSEPILAQAMEGRYRKHEVNRGLQARMLVRYFDEDSDAWRVKPELRRMVTWRQINLAMPFPLLGRFDIILLRNVLIYFSSENKKQVIDRTAKSMTEDGYLCLGGSETLMQIETPLQRETVGRAAVYRHPQVACPIAK